MKKAFNSKAFNRKYTCYKEDLGAIYSAQVSIFRVWSPAAHLVELALYAEGDGENQLEVIPMKKGKRGIWEVSVHKDLEGVYYTYRINTGKGFEEVMDPYAKACGVNGKRGMVVDLIKTNPKGWENHKRPQLMSITDAIIYEVHIRDLSIDDNGNMEHRGKFLALTERGTKTANGERTGLDHIKELGVTHVQLMPCYDYLTVDESKSEDEYNWGYDPLNYNIPEGSYATDPYHGEVRIKEFKEAIMALHENGLGVIMDVVYNHTALSETSNLNKLMPDYYYRTDQKGEFSNGSACGNEIASERVMVRKLIIDSLKYWAQEYQIDGFRFDLMGVLDIGTMNEIYDSLRQINPQIILYGEGWAGGQCALGYKKRAIKENAPLFMPIGVFNDDLRDGVKGDVFIAEGEGFISGKSDMEESIKFGIVAATKHPQIDYSRVNYSKAPYAACPGQSINYVSAHDNLTLWDKIEVCYKNKLSAGKNSGTDEEKDLEARQFSEKVKMHKLANAIILTSQGVPFLHGGVEFARTKKGDDNSYIAGDEVNRLDWRRKTEFKEIFEYYKGLIELRKKHPAFRMTTTKEIKGHLHFLDLSVPNMVGYRLSQHAGNDEWEEIVVLFNGSDQDHDVILPKSKKTHDATQSWQVVVNGHRAGVDTIETIYEDRVGVESKTAMVLVKMNLEEK